LKKLAPGLLAGTAALALSITVLQPAQANPSVRSPQEGSAAVKSKPDNRPGPKTKQQNRLRTKALTMLQNGTATLKLGYARGVALLTPALAGVPGSTR